MSETEDFITYRFLWKTSGNPCHRCARLHGQIFTGQDIFAQLLFDRQGVPIWNLDADYSLAHGYARFNCRCSLEVTAEIDLSKLSWWTELTTLGDKV